eukprot:scaffold7037_cov311-Pinguiococcus_pyrenoidosus.AAC.9
MSSPSHHSSHEEMLHADQRGHYSYEMTPNAGLVRRSQRSHVGLLSMAARLLCDCLAQAAKSSQPACLPRFSLSTDGVAVSVVLSFPRTYDTGRMEAKKVFMPERGKSFVVVEN